LFFSLSGAYETPIKIELPEESQMVKVAGAQGAAQANNMDWSSNARIGCSPAGVLWLGLARHGPAADLSSCQLWISRDELAEGYSGGYSYYKGTLAQSLDFTCDEMEVWQVQAK